MKRFLVCCRAAEVSGLLQ